MFIHVCDINTTGAGFLFVLKAGKDVPFDFTISDVFMYEGAYVNPPIYVSLDANPNIKFLPIRQGTPFCPTFKSVACSTKSYKRIFKIPTRGWGDNPSNSMIFYGVLDMFKSYKYGFNEVYEIEFSYCENGTDGKSYYIRPRIFSVVQANQHPRFSKFRFARGSDGFVYLEGYYNNTNTDNIMYYIREWNAVESSDIIERVSYVNNDNTQIHYEQVINDDMVLSNTSADSDTILGAEVNTIINNTSF